MKTNKLIFLFIATIFLLLNSTTYSQTYSIISPGEGDTYESFSEIKIIIFSDAQVPPGFKIKSIKLIQRSNNAFFDLEFDPSKVSINDKAISLKVKVPQNVEQNCELELTLDSSGTQKIKSPLFTIQNVIPGKTDYDLSLGTTLSLADGVKPNHFYGSLGMFKNDLHKGFGFSAYLTTGESVSSADENHIITRNDSGRYNFYKEKTENTNRIVSVGGTLNIEWKDLYFGILLEYRNMHSESVGKYKILKADGSTVDSTFSVNSNNDEHNYGPVAIYNYVTKNITLNLSFAFLWTTNSNQNLGIKHATYDVKFLLKETQSGIGIGGEIKKVMFTENTNPTEFMVYIGKSFSLKNFFDGLVGANK